MKPKIALVTGASRGIGRGIALELAKNGYILIITCNSNNKKLQEVRTNIQSLGTICYTFTGDLSQYETASELFNFIHSMNLKIDVLVNNAGISWIGLLQDMSKETWQKIWNTNVTSAVSLSSQAIPDMLSAGSGDIINISSVWGLVGASCEVAYSATKGAINSFTLALAKELELSDIRVNAIACGIIDTDMNSHLSKEELDSIISQIPSGRIGTPEDVGKAVIKILDNKQTGQIIKLDGGWIKM
ncbi:MAG: elongation factor P 5-aminopentanone reductase [Eubacterium sp.]